ncbi:MAG TPA: hypothetical protein VGG33_18970 [Polyangia bacterium]
MTTEVVVALGAVDLLAAVGEPIEQPPAVRRALAGVPRAHETESVIAAAPTLLLGMEVVGQRSPELVKHLQARGTDVLLGNPQSLDDVFSFVTTVAARIDRVSQATALIDLLRQNAGAALTTFPPSQVEDRAVKRPSQVEVSSAPGASKVEVFVFDCCEPPFVAGGRGVLSDLIGRAGGRNVFADVEAAWGTVSWEMAIARTPRLIVINDYAMDGQDDVAGKRARLAAIPSLAQVPTVVMPLGETLGGIRSVDGLARLARAIAALPASPEPRL